MSDCFWTLDMRQSCWISQRLIIAGGVALSCCMVVVSCQSAERVTDTPVLQRQTSVEDAKGLGIGERFTLPALVTLDGRTVEAAELFEDRRAVVVAMTSTGCPLSRKYGPRLAGIEREYAAKGVAFVYVNTVEAESEREMREQVREFGFAGPYLPDRDRAVASTFGVRTTTEVFVLDSDSRLVYRGAVDDQYGVGTSLPAPRGMYLRDALDATLAGRAGAPGVKATFAPGCLVDVPRKKAETSLTYFGSAAHILAANCVSCHRPGGVAPFSLATYPDILGRVSMIEAVVRDELMPPSNGRVTSELGAFDSPRQMSDGDRADLLEWLGSEHALGSFAEGPRPPSAASDEWRVGGARGGRPDLLYMTPTLRLPADGPLVHKRSVMQLQIAEDGWVREIEFRPVKPDTVHHALVWILPEGVEPPAGDAPVEGLELLGVYSPAQTLVRYPEGVARRLPRGCSLLVDQYAQPMGREMMSSLRMAIGLGERPREEVKSVVVQDVDLEIASGGERETGRAEARPGRELRVLSVFPSMRARGTSMSVRTGGAAGRQDARSLLEAPRYDYRWQMRYVFEEPVVVAPGQRVVVTGTFDNSAGNANNPDPSRTVRPGAGAGDESLMAVLEVLERVE